MTPIYVRSSKFIRCLSLPKRLLRNVSTLNQEKHVFRLKGVYTTKLGGLTFHSVAKTDSNNQHRAVMCVRKQSTATVIDEEKPATRNVIPFILADIGEGISEVELLQWYVEKGDRIAQFDRVCEVQSDKATVEISSRYDGVVQSLNGKVGEIMRVGSPLLHIAVADSEASSDETQGGDRFHSDNVLHSINDQQDQLHIPNKKIEFKDVSVSENSHSPPVKKVLTTPAVRKLGMENKIDLSSISGSGPHGRILKGDVLQLLHANANLTVNEGIESLASTERVNPTILSDEDETVPIRGYNRLMCKTMTASLQIPHMCYADEINMNAVLKCRRDLNPIAEANGVKLSLLAFVIKAASLAMKEYRVINSSLDADQYTLTYKANHNIGIAMDTPRGLVVPVIKGCQNLSIFDIAREIERLKQCALNFQLTEEDITGGTFTISNIGAIGGTYMSPIVSSPQVAIGAMGKIQRLPRFVGEKVEEVNIMQISWGGDHRVIDGATMARFSNRWKQYLESPITMLMSMK